MKTIFLTDNEIKILKKHLTCPDKTCIRSILAKVEKVETRKTSYEEVYYHLKKEAHQEVIAYFRAQHIKRLDYNKCLYVVPQARIISIKIDNYGIYADCSNGKGYDISYSDSLFPIIKYLRKSAKKHHC